MQLVTHQTGPAGQKVRRLLIEEGADIQQGALRRHGRRPRDAARVPDGELRGRHGHRGGRREDAGEDPQGVHRSAPRASPTPRPTTSRARSAFPTASLAQGARDAAGPLPRVRRDRRVARRDQPADRHRRRPRDRARRQAQLRFERALPPSRHRGDARPRRGGSGRGRGVEIRPLVHLARRQHRLPRQRRRTRDGDDGHDQAVRRASRRTSSTSAAARRPRR